MQTTQVYVPFLYKEKTPDGDGVFVYGKVTGEELDLDQQVVDATWAREALNEWFQKAANIRVMHNASLPPAGKGVELTENETGFWLNSKIIEPSAVRLVREDVYTGYSIGIRNPRIGPDSHARNGRIMGGKIVEVSLVDYPCLESAKIVSVSDIKNKFVVAELDATGDTVMYKGASGSIEDMDEENTEEKGASGSIEDMDEEQKAARSFEDSPESEEEVDDSGAAADAKDDEHEERDSPSTKKKSVAKPRARKTVLIEKCADCGCNCTQDHRDPKCKCDCAICTDEPRAEKRQFSEAQRKRLAKEGKALEDGSYPIVTRGDLKNAIESYGRANKSDRTRVKRHIIERARKLNAMSELPADWKVEKFAKVILSLHKLGNTLEKRAFYSEEARQGAKRAFDNFLRDLGDLDPIFDAVEMDIEPPTDDPYPGEAHPDGQPESSEEIKSLRKQIEELTQKVTGLQVAPATHEIEPPAFRTGVKYSEPTVTKAAPVDVMSERERQLRSWIDAGTDSGMVKYAIDELFKMGKGVYNG